MAEAALIVATVATAGGQIFSGIAADKAAKEQASLQEEQARLALSESEREATMKADERRKFLAKQRMAYLASGISLVGTPGIVQADTFNEFQKEIDAIRKSGAAQFRLGMREAAGTRSGGRAKLISGIMSGIGTAGGGLYKSGIFDKKTEGEK